MASAQDLSAVEQLAYSTIRIECTYPNGNTGTGTGFFFRFLENKETGLHIPVIITNKHVIEKATLGRLVFSQLDGNGQIQDNIHYTCTVYNFEKHFIKHPDVNVDLCAMPIAGIITEARAKGIRLFFATLDNSIISSDKNGGSSLDAIEEILMIGYPTGLWDDINNKPIFRRGITATHPNRDYLGKKEFVIDAACFPGSSGSPVFIQNSGAYGNRNGGVIVGSRVLLLGVLYAGPVMQVTGEIVAVDIPTVQTSMAVSQAMINLGFVIKAKRILELERLFAPLNASSPAA